MPAICVLTAVAPADLRLLTRAHDSLLAQRGAEWEWVIVQDGPGAPTAEAAVAAGRVRSDPRVRWHELGSAGGPAIARNMGAAMARAPVLRNLDADDELHDASVLARTLAALDAAPQASFAVGPVIDADEQGRRSAPASPLAAGFIAPGTLLAGWEERQQVGLVHPTSLAVRAGAFFASGGYPGLAAAEDTALLLRLNAAEPGLWLTEPVTLHHKHAASITRQDWYAGEADRALRHDFVRRSALLP